MPLTDVVPDRSIHYGTLANGMKYAVMANGTPKGAAVVRLRFEFGSLAESDAERGLAHFIEHMAFNGSNNVPEGEMVKTLERLGLKFGPDTNASTGFDSTTYKLDLPRTDAEHVDTAMFLLREVASELTFEPDAIDRERGVILSEKRTRDNFRLHKNLDLLRFVLPETPYADRQPIGVEQVLNTASAEAMRKLYWRYYRPENATLVFVGDADPAVIETKIRETFGDWQPIGEAGGALPRGRVDLARGAAFDTFIHPALATSVDWTVFRPWQDPADTLAKRRDNILVSLAVSMFNRRLRRIVSAPGSPLLGGGMSTGREEDAALTTRIRISAKDGAWRPALEAAEQEVRRAIRHGFSQSELDLQLKASTAVYWIAAEGASTRRHAALAAAILAVIGEDNVVTTPQFRLEQFERVAKTVTPEEVSATFRSLWEGSEPLIHLSAKQDVPTEILAEALAASRNVEVRPPEPVSVKAFAYENYGTPGTVAEDKRVEDLGLRTVRFDNNVRLNIKTTDYEAGRVRFLVRLGDGLLDLPVDKPGLALMMTLTSSLGGLEKHSLEELRQIAAGRVVTLGAKVAHDAFVSGGSTTADDLPLQMKISAAYLLHPGFRPEAVSKWHNAIPVVLKQLKAQPSTVAAMRLPIELADGDLRFGVPAGPVLAKRSLDEARAALEPVVESAPIEISIVGDIEEDAAIAAVAETFGALPLRDLSHRPSAEVLDVNFRAERDPILLTHDGPADQSLVAAIWPTDDDSDYRTLVGLGVLTHVLDLMLTDDVRERLGDSYSVSVSNKMSDIYPDFGYFAARAIVAPDKADEVLGAFKRAASSLRHTPISEDLLARARNPILERIKHSRRQNGFWLGAISEAQTRPERLDRIRIEDQIVRSVTPADLQAIARRFLRPERLQLARVVSSKVAKTASRQAEAAELR